MHNTITANQIKIISKTKSTSHLNGSITTNGGIGCVNIYCECDINAKTIYSNCLFTEQLNFTGNLIVNKNIYPKTNVNNIGSSDLRWNNIYTNNLDAIGHIVLGLKNDEPQIEIDEQIIINSDIIMMHNTENIVKITNNNININGDVNINNILKIVGNNKVQVKGKFIAETVKINNFVEITPQIICIDKLNYDIIIQSSVIVLKLKINSNIKFKINENTKNILIKFIIIESGDYQIEFQTENGKIKTNKNFNLFLLATSDDEIKYYIC